MTVGTARPLPLPGRDWRALLQLAWPMLIGQLAQIGMGVVDTVMAGAVGRTDLAAVAVGFSMWMPVYVMCLGVLSAVTATVARAEGAKDRAALAASVRQGVWLAGGLAAIALTLMLHGDHLLVFMGVDPAVRPMAALYLEGMAIGAPAMMLFLVLRGLTEGGGSSRPVMVIQVLAFLSNVPLNYLFIHGELGLPALGGAGCGWASGFVMWIQLTALAVLTRRRWRPLLHGFGAVEPRRLWSMLRLGFPVGAAMFAETSIFALVALLIGRLGATTLAAHQIALNFSALLFMVPTSLGLALTVKVGHALGAGEPARARRYAAQGAWSAVFFACCSAFALLVFPYSIVSLYTPDEAVRQLAVTILAYSAAFQLSDGLQVTAAGSLRGYHDTRMTMVITLLAYWGVGMPLGYALGLTDLLGPRQGVLGLWTGLVAGLTVAALLLNARLLRISGRHLRAAGLAVP
ncbi:MAG: Multidrug resistance protein NorM [Gammaproteobacteria bacterium]|nr:Multidrug resistance protein NorM [Gammaproteobacteria bacterium]